MELRVAVSKERIEAAHAELRVKLIREQLAAVCKGARKARVDALVARDIGCVPQCLDTSNAEHFWRLAEKKLSEAMKMIESGARTKDKRARVDRFLANATVYAAIAEAKAKALRALL